MSRPFWPIVFLVGLISLVFIGSAWSSLNKTNQPATADSKTSDILQPFLVDEPIPQSSVKDSKGAQIDLTNHFSQTSLITFWNSNCHECQAELPELGQFSQNHPEIKVELVNYRQDRQSAQVALQNFKTNLPTFFDSDGSAYQAWSATMPATYFIKNNRIKFYFPGRISTQHLNSLLTQI